MFFGGPVTGDEERTEGCTLSLQTLGGAPELHRWVRSRVKTAAANENKSNLMYTSNEIQSKRGFICFYRMCVSIYITVLDAGGVRHMEKVVISLLGSRGQRPPQTPAAPTLLIKLQTTHTCVSAPH